MKFLLTGCFHGKVPKNLFSAIKKEHVDCLLITGDFVDGSGVRNIEFGNYEKVIKFLRTGHSWEESLGIIGGKRLIKKYKNEIKKDNINVKKLLSKIVKIKIPVYYGFGNHESYPSTKKIVKNTLNKRKNFYCIHKKIKRIKGIDILGYTGYRGSSEKVYLDMRRLLSSQAKKELTRKEKRMRSELKQLFKKTKQPVILLTHDPPYGRLDTLYNRKSFLHGKCIGEKITREADKKFKPLIHCCGHMHETRGMAKIGKTIVINHGLGQKGHFATFEIIKNSIKNIKFY